MRLTYDQDVAVERSRELISTAIDKWGILGAAALLRFLAKLTAAEREILLKSVYNPEK